MVLGKAYKLLSLIGVYRNGRKCCFYDAQIERDEYYTFPHWRRNFKKKHIDTGAINQEGLIAPVSTCHFLKFILCPEGRPTSVIGLGY